MKRVVVPFFIGACASVLLIGSSCASSAPADPTIINLDDGGGGSTSMTPTVGAGGAAARTSTGGRAGSAGRVGGSAGTTSTSGCNYPPKGSSTAPICGTVGGNATAGGGCWDAKCCTPTNACMNDATCKTCIVGPTADPSCGSPSGPSTNTLFNAVSKCLDAQCSSCPEFGALICDSGYRVFQMGGGKACADCMSSSCCSQAEACANDSACDTCFLVDPNAAACNTEATYQAFDACGQKNCKAPCLL